MGGDGDEAWMYGDVPVNGGTVLRAGNWICRDLSDATEEGECMNWDILRSNWWKIMGWAKACSFLCTKTPRALGGS